MTLALVAEDRGQALVVVAGAMAVLIAALVLSVEWGYGFTQRRGAQNDADAAALAVGRHLASTFVAGDQPFGATVEELCFDAARFTAAGSGEVLTLSFMLNDGLNSIVMFTDATGGSAGSVSTATCATGAGGRLAGTTAFVRVRATRTYPSMFGGVLGRTTMEAAASARTRLTSGALLRRVQLPVDPLGQVGDAGKGVSGLSTAPSVAIWPLVRYFDPLEVASWTACGAYCARTPGNAVSLWQTGGPTSTFRGLISPSHFTIRGAAAVHQLVTESDWSGSNPGAHGHPNTARLQTHGEGGCSAAWDTQGTSDRFIAARCDVPNWFWYGYRGSLSLDTDWTSTGTWASRGYIPSSIIPMSLPSAATRRSCQSVPPYFVALDLVPSCSRQVGDWVETVNGRAGCDGGCGDESENLGDLTSRMRASIRQFIAQYGRVLPNSDGVRAVVVNVFLWDCADQFSSGTGTWSRASDSSCGPITDPDALRRVGRVHIFTVAPFTVYADDVTDSHLYGYWGNAFGDAGTCQQSWSTVPTPAACQLNPLINSAFLVPDE